ncbi:MAG: flavin reductase family protein [Acinetobacter populi]|jgi:flavin reductase (DIM6/NTAB) family NADH-FMN oxidoreductase RutF|uniref:flavin reductase family protein n=1 Tax=Acinetobacter populi TaxID=1582270 RepID=UPI002356C7EB|nr:flavin reductase family protein [Acinetobacter populi]MCH4246858.1 flavin reductase family protein [Acinetobacter populi]
MMIAWLEPRTMYHSNEAFWRSGESMDQLALTRAFTLLESGPVILLTTQDGEKSNIMTLTWSMVLDFPASFAISTGEWNYSYAALSKNRECTLAIPTVDLLDRVIGVGTCSGADTNKFEKFGFSKEPAKYIQAPLIKECVANIECKVVDMIERYHIIVLEGLAAYYDHSRLEQRTCHAVGDGTFIVDGEKIDRREMMKSKLPDGL